MRGGKIVLNLTSSLEMLYGLANNQLANNQQLYDGQIKVHLNRSLGLKPLIDR